jgi:oxygen-independent coproporphyrinogen-3 oxidase
VTARGGDSGRARHLYVHLPFSARRSEHADFVTVVGCRGRHGEYVDALLAELALERPLLAEHLETVFLGGGTPTFTDPDALAWLLAALPPAAETTVEASPETLTQELACLLRRAGVSRVSVAVESFQAHLLSSLGRRVGPGAVRRSVYALRDAGFDNISLDLVYGIPRQGAADLARDLEEALALEPEHVSCYELLAEPGTRFAHTYGDELARQREAMEGYFEQVVESLTAAGYRWYETSSFCLTRERAAGRDLRSAHNVAYWLGRDYVGLGLGAVSTVGAVRRRNTSQLDAYTAELAAGRRPPRELESLPPGVLAEERLMLALRLDEPVRMADVAAVLDHGALARLERLGLAERASDSLRLTPRGRFLGGAVTVELLAS